MNLAITMKKDMEDLFIFTHILQVTLTSPVVQFFFLLIKGARHIDNVFLHVKNCKVMFNS